MKNTAQKGFTLIELLVVIGILGVLAGALFFTINPIEQLSRGDDAKLKSASTSFVTAMNSYYSTNRDWPWNTADACNGQVVQGTPPTDGALSSTEPAGCVQDLIDNDFLRDSFTNDTDAMDSIRLNADADGFSICFPPSSTAEQNSPEADYNADGTSPHTTGDVHWCVVQ